MFLTDEALALGLVNRAFEPAVLVEEAMAYARDVAINCSPASVAAIKSQVYRHFALDADAASRDSEDIMLRSLEGPDLKEGVTSFLEAPDAALCSPGARHRPELRPHRRPRLTAATPRGWARRAATGRVALKVTGYDGPDGPPPGAVPESGLAPRLATRPAP